MAEKQKQSDAARQARDSVPRWRPTTRFRVRAGARTDVASERTATRRHLLRPRARSPARTKCLWAGSQRADEQRGAAGSASDARRGSERPEERPLLPSPAAALTRRQRGDADKPHGEIRAVSSVFALARNAQLGGARRDALPPDKRARNEPPIERARAFRAVRRCRAGCCERAGARRGKRSVSDSTARAARTF